MIVAIVVILLSGPVSGMVGSLQHLSDKYNLGTDYFPPAPEGDWYVYDVAGVISNETEQEFEEELVRIQEEYGVLVRLVTIENMRNYGVGPWDPDEDFFSEDEGYARQMFKHFGMEDGEEPSMMIALSTGDRQFKFVMPDMPALNQRISGDVFINQAWMLTDAADHYGVFGSMYRGYANCYWGEPDDRWYLEVGYPRIEMWVCNGRPNDPDDWQETESYCENRDYLNAWYCYDHPWVVEEDCDFHTCFVGGGPENANGTLLDIKHEYTRGNMWEIALSKYVNKIDDIVEPEPWHWSVHLSVYSLGLLGLAMFVSFARKERVFEYEGWEEVGWAEERVGFAYARRRGMLSLKSLKGEPDGTVFDKVSDQIEELTKAITGELRDLGDNTDLYKSCIELNKRADDLGIPEEVSLIDLDLEEEITMMKEYGNTRDKINSVFLIFVFPAYIALMYLGLSMVAYHPFTLGGWVLDDPWLLLWLSNGTVGLIVVGGSIGLFLLHGFVSWSVPKLVKEISGVRPIILPFRRPRPSIQVTDYSNVVIPMGIGAYLASDVASGGYIATSAGFDEYGNEIYDVSRPVSSGDGCSGGGCGGGCGGGGCGGGGGGCGGGGGF